MVCSYQFTCSDGHDIYIAYLYFINSVFDIRVLRSLVICNHGCCCSVCSLVVAELSRCVSAFHRKGMVVNRDRPTRPITAC